MGELAALATAIIWSFTSILFTLAGRRVGAMVINRTRVFIALMMLVITHSLLYRSPIPLHADQERWIWLGASGIMGLVIGDSFTYKALVLIGPRLTMLVLASAPVISTIFAWFFLGEILDPLELVAISVTISGVTWVVLEGHPNIKNSWDKTHLLGIFYAAVGSVSQSLSWITAKEGLAGEFPALSGMVISMLVALIIHLLLAFVLGELGSTIAALSDRNALKIILVASVLGSFLGVWLSYIAIELAPVGIASTLIALPPIFLIPLTRLFFKENISRRSVIGTLVVLAGVTMIFFDI
jgi:uncharacterized membrane protein